MGTTQGDSAQTVYLYTGLANNNQSPRWLMEKLQHTAHVDYCNKQSPSWL